MQLPAPDPTKQLFATRKARAAQGTARAVMAPRAVIGALLERFVRDEGVNHFRHVGDGPA